MRQSDGLRRMQTFERLEEEHLRDFYLVVLNGHYEGRASGETLTRVVKQTS
jgi:hypothetical protein